MHFLSAFRVCYFNLQGQNIIHIHHNNISIFFTMEEVFNFEGIPPKLRVHNTAHRTQQTLKFPSWSISCTAVRQCRRSDMREQNELCPSVSFLRVIASTPTTDWRCCCQSLSHSTHGAHCSLLPPSTEIPWHLYILHTVRCPYCVCIRSSIRHTGRDQLSSEWRHNQNDVIMKTTS